MVFWTNSTNPVRILAALVNPVGSGSGPETVTLLNASPEPFDLAGWRLVDRGRNSFPLPSGPLASGDILELAVGAPFGLGDGGGTITLLDAAGLKVHGVSCTAAEAREGWTVTF
jgi:hypothetical protein